MEILNARIVSYSNSVRHSFLACKTRFLSLFWTPSISNRTHAQINIGSAAINEYSSSGRQNVFAINLLRDVSLWACVPTLAFRTTKPKYLYKREIDAADGLDADGARLERAKTKDRFERHVNEKYHTLNCRCRYEFIV